MNLLCSRDIFCSLARQDLLVLCLQATFPSYSSPWTYPQAMPDSPHHSSVQLLRVCGKPRHRDVFCCPPWGAGRGQLWPHEASTFAMNCNLGSGIGRTGEKVNLDESEWKAPSASGDQENLELAGVSACKDSSPWPWGNTFHDFPPSGTLQCHGLCNCVSGPGGGPWLEWLSFNWCLSPWISCKSERPTHFAG